MEGKIVRRLDGVYRRTVSIVVDTWKNHPFRIPALMIAVLLASTVSTALLYVPNAPLAPPIEKAKANTYQFTPTAGNLVTGTALNANSLLAAAAEGVNTGSWKGTLADDNFHWMVDILASSTPNINMQLDLGAAKVSGANKLLIQTEIDLDKVGHLLKVQICDWVSSTSVDAAADSQCTTGGWRTLNSQTAANADVDIALTTSGPFQWHIYDGYFTTGTTGGTAVSTPLTNFTSSDTQPLRIRYWSDTDTTCTSDCNLAIDFLRANAFVDSIYYPAGAVNQNGSGGALAGTYANAQVIGNSATAQQSVTAGNAVYLTGAGTAGSVADYYLQFKNVKTYVGANTFYFKADYSCSAATAGLDHKFQIYNFTTTTWVDLNSAVIACSTTDATNAWAENNITVADFIDESSSDEVRVRFLGDLNSTTTLRIDFAYLMIGSTNSDSAQCEVTWGTGTATNCANTRDLIGPAAATVFSNPAEDKSNTVDNDYYALDCPASATAGECSAANIDFPVTVPADAQVVVDHFAGKFAGDLVGTTNPDLTTQMGLRDFSGTPTSVSGPGGWTLVGASSATLTQIYTDSITALAIGTYGMQINPDDHIDTANNEMNIRMRSTAEGLAADNSRFEWDFAMVSIGWVVDSSHPTRNYQFAPTGDTLVAGAEVARLGLTAPSATVSANTGGWQATLGDDNLEWTINGANVVGTNYDLQLNFATAKQNGANNLLIQTEFDTDANIAMNVQICDWVSSTSVDAAADAQCTTGGWRSLVSQTAANADVTYTGTTIVPLQWHIYDGYFTTGTTGGTPVSTPLTNFFHSSSGVKIRFFSATQSATAIDVDFVRIQPLIDSVYHPASVTNNNVSGGALAGTYANAQVVGNSATAQQSVTAGNAVYLTGAGTAGSVADYYLSFKNIKTYTGMNSFYFKADYSCSAATAGLDTEFAIWNFTSAAWEDLTSVAIACSTSDATHGWAKNNVTLTDYISGGETRVRFYGDLNSTTTLRLDFAYLMVGSTNADTADCAVTFGSGTATNCSNTRDLIGPGTAARFDNAAEDESATMGTGDANSYHAFDNETTPDTTAEESATSNISFPVTQPTNSSIVGENYAARFSGCGNTGAACGAATLTVQLGFKDYAGFNAATGGWLQLGGTSASSTLAYTDTITAMTIGAYGQQINPEDYIDTANNEVNLRLRTTTPGTAATNVTTVWDFAMVSIQWIEIGTIIDIQGNSSVASSTVAVAVDGNLQVNKTATAAGGSCPCAWTISSVFVAGGRSVTVWHDGASDANESSGVTVYDGSGNITGLQLTAHTTSIGSVDDQTVDSADLINFDNDADEDVMYKFVTTTFTADATSAYTDEIINILAGDTLSFGGSETLTGYSLVNDGTLTSGGATTYTVTGDWENNGTFNESTSTVTLSGATSENLDSGCSAMDSCTAENFYNLTINKTDAADGNDNVTITNTDLRVANLLTLTDGELIQGALSVRVEGASAVSIAAAGKWTNISTGDLKLGGTFVNDGTAIFNSSNGSECVDIANDIVITSTSGGSQRAWSGNGTETIYNVAVTDMTDSTVTAYTSTLSNTTWTEGSCAGNTAPDVPASIAQKRTTDAVLATGDWTNETSVKFTATATDTDNPDTLRLCVEIVPIASSFTNTETGCGTGVAYSGTGVAVTVTLSSLSNGTEYKWQARIKDAADAASAWVDYAANGASRDVGVDTSACSTATIYDGTSAGVDAGYNDSSVTALSGNWDAFTCTVSGLQKYEYSIGVTAGGTTIKGWTDNTTSTSVTSTSLTLHTNENYFVNVRATDNAGNVSSVASSNGQQVLPSLSFSMGANTITFSNLNSTNNRLDTQTVTVTTSTNAYGGYVIRQYAGGLLTDGTVTIPMFSAGSYAAPAAWGTGQCSGTSCGYGYTSSDTTIQGSNLFSGGTLYAPFSQTVPGDIVADHTTAIDGSSGAVTNEQFTITHKVAVTALQAAEIYQATVYYIVTGTF